MIKLVIIDDEEWIRKLVKKLLPYDRFSIRVVGEAEDGRGGIDLLKKTRPDVILTDIRMPYLSGLELIDKIKSILPESEIIIISGFDQFEYAQKAIKLGVNDFLVKPVEKDELGKSIEKAIESINNLKTQKNKNRTLERTVKRLTTDFLTLNLNEFPDIKNEKIRKALKYIHQNFNKQISLYDICDNVIINITYFSEMFKKEVGIGFHQYLTRLRFKNAEELLVENLDLPIKDISRIVGYTDPNYFCRTFKNKYKCTPLEYRNKKINTIES